MFTGLVEGCGTVVSSAPDGPGIRLVIEVPEGMQGGCEMGASVAINGCCLTVVDFDGDRWSFQAGEETLSKTSLGQLDVGRRVNLERSLPVDGRLGGHFVLGHVDGTGQIDIIRQDGEWTEMWFNVGRELAVLMVSKGSVAVEGISLTVCEVTEDRFSVALIPHTLEVTTLGQCRAGDLVNIETDILGKYVQKLCRRD